MGGLKLIVLFLLIFVGNVWSDGCTPAQKNEMMSCSAKFFEAQGFYQNDGKNGKQLLIKLANSWDEFENMCLNINNFQTCLKPETVKNCISKKHDKSKDGFFDISPHALYLTGGFICGIAREKVKRAYSCVTNYCSDETETCKDFANSMVDCIEISTDMCGFTDTEVDKVFLSSVFMARRCQNKITCHMCTKSDILGQIMSYRSMLNFGDGTFTVLKENLKNPDSAVRLKAVKEFQEMMATEKLSKESAIENGLLLDLRHSLSSKNAEVKAEAAAALKYLIDGSPGNLDAIVESEIIPALIRNLISMDENVLENVIETLATIISKQPKLRNFYMDLNIVESLLLSYSPDISREMQHHIAQIIANLCGNLELEAKVVIEQLIPLLSELINKYDSKKIIDVTKNFVKAAQNDESFKIDIDVMETIADLVDHQNEDLSNSAIFAAGYFFVNTVGAEKLEQFRNMDSAEVEEAYNNVFDEEDKINMFKKLRFEL